MNLPWGEIKLIPVDDFRELRMRMIFENFKLDPQVEDASSLSRIVLILKSKEWKQLKILAERLAAETLDAEEEMFHRPDLHRDLAIPMAIRRIFRKGEPCGSAARVMRFDFHFAREGWRISEVNSDVPGGFIEGSGFTELVAEHFDCSGTPGDPANSYALALAEVGGSAGTLALVHASAYSDDRQVMMYLQRRLSRLGVRAILCSPDQIIWKEGRALIDTLWHQGPASAIMRFFPAEWLPNLPRRRDWRHYFAGSHTLQSNPGQALLSQSKRFPLVWNKLETPVQTWQTLLPETHDPRHINWKDSDEWILKPAMGRVGDGILMPGITAEKQAKALKRWSRWFPNRWIAQRRFETLGLDTPLGKIYPCLGVYVINGEACGVYARISQTPLIDGKAADAAVLLAESQQMNNSSADKAEVVA